MDEKELLKEIKALLEEQNRLIGGLKSQYEAMAAKNVEHMAKTNWRYWIMLAVLLLLLFIPNITAK
ncbi:MAG: hypothetical protein ACT4P3_00840 [Betaproteobacteria bacterium]